ncbi:MAG TPA: phenylalanine--tRNA ligase beta subunit-related protein [Ktedonobacterales bacterium]|nr:phenylalanine--tRNA ligase beta subunit-related protein [Ktedonobacterales bacterium]
MLTFTIAELIERFSDFRIGVIVAEGLTIQPGRPPALEQAILAAEQEAAAALAETALADIPELRCWREAYKAFGVKKTSYRSSVERLLKRVQQGSGLPRVNNLVDAYNLVSLRYRMPVGADDLDKVVSPLAFRYARPDDTFIALGDENEKPDPPASGEVVYADAEKLLCRRWNWYQDTRSPISATTTRAVLTVQALEPTAALVEEAVTELCTSLAAYCGARTSWAVADREQPEVTLALSSSGV